MSYLLDTNILCESSKPRPNAGVVSWMRQASVGRLMLSVVTIGEIRRGVERLRARNDHPQARRYEQWLAETQDLYSERLIPVDIRVAETWGDIDAQHPLATTDGLIAATAKVHGLTVITRNTKDFHTTGVRILNPFTS
ncbi:type II toxin-antitoxin system VapC family toxin [Fodinicola feengrottensis]|nr:type II toxin-antitoxin system VapC family toxin [Fodinicola feengrottensis]